MTESMLDDAFAHHVWASVRLLDACAGLTPEQDAKFWDYITYAAEFMRNTEG